MNTNHWEQLAARHHSWLPPTEVTAYGRPSDSSNLEDRARSHKPSAGFSEARLPFSSTSQRQGPVERVTTTGLSRHDNPEAVVRRIVSELLEPMFHNSLLRSSCGMYDCHPPGIAAGSVLCLQPVRGLRYYCRTGGISDEAKLHPNSRRRKQLRPGSFQVVQGAAHRLQGRAGHMGIDLGGAGTLVTEKLLDDTEVRAAFQEVGREAVT